MHLIILFSFLNVLFAGEYNQKDLTFEFIYDSDEIFIDQDSVASFSGSIINISSISATRPKGYTSYSASKGAVISLTKAMAVDHGSEGIRVNCILPGPVYTPMVYQEGMSDKLREVRKDASLLNIEGNGYDIGRAVVYLCSNWARYITGHFLVVDGGCSLSAKPRG